ncbi:MAG: ATP-dependent Clp protease ATP-binding subunit [Bacilli bacterium]|nr:ATP-dependent Clp protease ATP-binding subunit [Bacilli bacterium]
MFSKFDEKARKVLVNMQKEMISLKHPYVGSEHLLLSLLKYGENDFLKRLEDVGVTYDSFKKELIKVVGIGKSNNDFYLYTPLLRNVLEVATMNSTDKGKSCVDTSDLFLALFEEGEGVAIRLLVGMDVDIDSLYDEFYTCKKSKKSKLLVDSFGVDLNLKCKNGEVDPVVARDKEISRLIEILSRRTKNNPLLLGNAGVGKTAIVEELARRLELGYVPVGLRGKRIVSVSMATLVAGTKYRGEFEEKLTKIISELEENDNVILFIDEIHTLVGAGGAEGAIDASNILKPALARGKVRIIGATTTSEYKEYIESDKALSRRFQTVMISEPSVDDTVLILKRLRPIYENYHMVKISDEIIDKIVSLSDKYIYDRRFPDKAIDVMDEVCSRVSVSTYNKDNFSDISTKLSKVKELKNKSIMNNKFDEAFLYKKTEMILEDKKNRLELKTVKKSYKNIKESDVLKVVEDLSKIPIDSNSSSFFNRFKKDMSNVIFGQEEVIDIICNTFRKHKYNSNNKPLSFLFLGPTGVGKTVLAKEYGKYFYDDNVIKIDMSEYKEPHSVSKMIGSPPGYVGYNDSKNVFEIVKDNPYSLIILDEIEKASHEVINLFLQILDEGIATDSKGNKISFANTSIIMTSNLGASKNSIGFNNKTNYEDINKFFGVEFVNRISKVIKFKRIDRDVCEEIVNKKLNILRKKYKNKSISCSFSKNIISEIANLCEFEKYGARKIDNIINYNIEELIVNKSINGNNKIRIDSINTKVV